MPSGCQARKFNVDTPLLQQENGNIGIDGVRLITESEGVCRFPETAWQALQEKDQMLKWVEEEVDRVKAMFEEKESRLTATAQQAQRESAAAKAAQLSASKAQQHAEHQLLASSEALQVHLSFP